MQKASWGSSGTIGTESTSSGRFYTSPIKSGTNNRPSIMERYDLELPDHGTK